MYDIIIIGAGPSGSNLARSLNPKLKVLIIDKRSMHIPYTSDQKNKCCGGLLAPDAQKMMAKLGLGMPKEILVDPQLFAVRTLDIKANIERAYQRYYYNIDREKFDRWLVSMIPSTVDQWFNSVFKGYVETENGFKVTVYREGKTETVTTKIMVGADGAHSKIRSQLYQGENEPDKYIAIQEWFTCKDPSAQFAAIFDANITDFYAWVIPKDDVMMVGGAFPVNDDAHLKFRMLKQKLQNLGYNLDVSVKVEGAHINRPTRSKHLQYGASGILLVGEAAGAISPSSAEGISYALRSSCELAKSINENVDSETLDYQSICTTYQKYMKPIKLNLLGKRLKSPVMYHPLLRKTVMKSGLNSL